MSEKDEEGCEWREMVPENDSMERPIQVRNRLLNSSNYTKSIHHSFEIVYQLRQIKIKRQRSHAKIAVLTLKWLYINNISGKTT